MSNILFKSITNYCGWSQLHIWEKTGCWLLCSATLLQ